MKKLFVLIFSSILSILSFAQEGQYLFIDVAGQLGIDYQGKTFGSSWADINGDGRLDLYLSCHSNWADLYYENDQPVIYFNGVNSFSPEYILDLENPNTIPGTDWHGSAFFDVDRDGDLDQINMLGGNSENVFYVNNGSVSFEDQAAAFNLLNPNASGRTPGLLDINKDGYTDLILNGIEEAGGVFYPKLMLNVEGETFVEAPSSYNFNWTSSRFSTTTDFEGDGGMDLLTLSGRAIIYQVDTETLGTPQPIGSNKVFDLLIEDLNGDLKPDLFSGLADRGVYIEQIDSSLIRSSFSRLSPGVNFSFEFSSVSDFIDLTLFPSGPGSSYIIVIGDEVQDQVNGAVTSLTLSTNDSNVIGNPDTDIFTSQPRFYINFNPVSSKWTVTGKGGANASAPLGLDIEGSGLLITEDLSSGQNWGAELFYNEGNYLFTKQNLPVFNETDNFLSVVAADFDNDMDLDLYAVRTNYAKNKENVLWENDNNLNWIRHDGAWGAAGDGQGIGESVTTVDFNNDGFMDIFVTNGSSIFWLDEAKTNLYENQTNSNNWIKVELEGITSDPIGMHSRVILHAGGVSQLRYQNGGMHLFSQNDTRLHFGLAQNTSIDSLEVFWPSGIRQVITDLEINQIATIKEEVPCEVPYPQVVNLSTVTQPNGVLLEWDPIPGSVGCQVRGGLTNSSNLPSFQLLETNAREFFVPQSQLIVGQEYRWGVRCACTSSITGEWSSFEYFTWEVGSMKSRVQNKFIFYPNPVFTELNVSLDIEVDGDFVATFYDLQGRNIKEKVVHVELNQTLHFDLRDLESGVYIFQISNGEVIFSEKIVKQ